MVLGLDLYDFWGAVNSFRDQLYRTSALDRQTGTKLISINRGDLFIKSNYQNFSRYQEVDIAIAADSEATMPLLVEEVKGSSLRTQIGLSSPRGQARYGEQSRSVENHEEAAAGWDSARSAPRALPPSCGHR